MAKQDAPSGSPQQLSLDLNSTARESRGQPSGSACVANFVDSGTLAIRKRALERVKSARIFAVPSLKAN
jgi:hypothetical protein